ncbi:diacylglycerol kinase family protein [Novosphingobium sp.]|uniref:diacylglycerol kinase family protein n=1 Tax=Novosphingobium sp. TaxID=1874826 RepID=UPI00333E2495
MRQENTLWLVVNDTSGGNDTSALVDLLASIAAAGLQCQRTIHFPAEDLPTPQKLNKAEVAMLAIFAGDGTINAAVSGLSGWGGVILVLPGGTMNLLSKGLHGAASASEIIELIGSGKCTAVRPQVIQTSQGIAFAELLAGPGTSWAPVREALRDTNVSQMIETASEAITQTSEAPPLHLIDPKLGRENGYRLLALQPTQNGLHISGYCVESLGDFLRQGAAIVRRRFREGPHDDLGIVAQVTLAAENGGSMGLLLDGQPAGGEGTETFALTQCAVDLLATVPFD